MLIRSVTAAILVAGAFPARAAEPVMVQCGREYQAARSAGTLNGLDWNAYRVACAERLKATPAVAAPASPAAAPIAPPNAPSIAIVPSHAATGAGTTAMHARQKQCGAEWTAQKTTLVAQTAGLTWPKYWSQCNARIKTTGN